MRQPWYRLFLFFALLAIPLGWGEAYVRSLPNPAKSKHEYLSRHAAEVEVLILGSSHTYYGICPELLSPKAYSAAQVSQTLRYDDWLLHHYAFGPQLRTVIVPVSDFTLYEELEDGDEWYRANRYRLYMDCNIHSVFSVYNWEITAFRPFCQKLTSLWRAPEMTWSNYGQGLEYTLERRPANWNNGAERAIHNQYTDLHRADSIEQHLWNIARFCQQRNVQLLLISTPQTALYRNHQLPEQIADTQQRIARLQATYSKVKYINLSGDPRFTNTDFYDADHLNTRGAAKLSRIISPQLAAPVH